MLAVGATSFGGLARMFHALRVASPSLGGTTPFASPASTESMRSVARGPVKLNPCAIRSRAAKSSGLAADLSGKAARVHHRTDEINECQQEVESGSAMGPRILDAAPPGGRCRPKNHGSL